MPSFAKRNVSRWLALGVFVLVAVRFVALDADPPFWLPDAAVMDEALWADGARGKVLFDDWYADDTGNAWLTAPAYNGLVWLSYSLFGVSLWSTRLVPAVTSLLLLAIVGLLAGRRFGGKFGWGAALLLGLSPFLWAHSRFGLLEVPQALFIAASFALLLGSRRASATSGLLAGAAMAVAIGVKPNSVIFGVLPVGAAWLVRTWLERNRPPRARLLQAGAAILGGCVGLGVLAVIIGPSRWGDLWQTWNHEGGIGRTSLGDHLLRLGFVGSREGQAGSHALWGLLRSAPLLSAAVWFAALHAVLRMHGGARRRPSPWEGAVLAWAVVTFFAAEISYTSAARRAVHLMAPMALLVVAWWHAARRPAEIDAPVAASAGGGRWARCVLWVLLTTPVAIAVKPAVANAMRGVVRPWFGPGADPTLVAGAAGWLFLAAWAVVLAVLSTLRTRPAPLARFALSRLARPTLVVLVVVEAAMIGAHLWRPRYTILAAQEAVQAVVAEGEVVFGHMAALLVEGKRARAVRWVREAGPGYAGPRPNPDAFARLQPRYIVTHVSRANRWAAEPAYAPVIEGTDPVIDARFEPVLNVQMCLEPGGYPRWILQLCRRVE